MSKWAFGERGRSTEQVASSAAFELRKLSDRCAELQGRLLAAENRLASAELQVEAVERWARSFVARAHGK